MTQTEEYIQALTSMKVGEMGLLRRHAMQRLDESVDGFDLFAGRWWPLRKKSERAPRREVAWLIAKLYAFRPIPNSPGETLARQLRRCAPLDQRERDRFRQRFDRILSLPLDQIEPALQRALGQLGAKGLKVDWVKLTDDLSRWEHESVRRRWAEEYLESMEGVQSC